MGAESPDDVGLRLAAQSRWLEMLFLHLAGRQVRRQVPLEDLVQEVFLRVLASTGRLPAAAEGEPALKRYLARVARSCVMDVLRCLRAAKRSGREVALVRSDWSVSGVGPGQIAAVVPGPATRAAGRETSSRLIEAYMSLSAEYRRVIGLRQFEGLSAAESALRMGRSEAAIHSLYRRALEAWSQAR